MKFHRSLIKYAAKYGETKADIKHDVTRQYIYCWKRKYGGMLQSLTDRLHRLEHHPNQHTEDEIKLIKEVLWN